MSVFKIRSLRLFTIAVFVSAGIASGHSQIGGDSTSLAIDSNRQFVYLMFDHVGKGIKRSDSEPELRIWLRFVNNSHFPIILRTCGLPDGSPQDEVGIMDIVAKDPPMRIIITYNSDTKPEGDIVKIPDDYWSEVGSEMTLQPGKEILFSVPIDHLGKEWHMEIPFSFKNSGGKFPRDPMTGGQLEMRLSYALYDLPDEARKKIEKQMPK